MLQALRKFRRLGAQFGFEPGHVELGGGQQRPEFVVQLARQMPPLLFAHQLQVGRQFREGRRPLANLALQQVALLLQGPLLFFPGALEHRALAQVEVEGDQAGQCDCCDSDAREQQRTPHLHLTDLHPAGTGPDQFDGLLPDCIHVLLADIRHHHKLPGLLVALLAHAHRKFHFGELALDIPSQLGQGGEFVRVRRIEQPQVVQLRGRFRHCGAVGFQVARVGGQQEAAGTRLCVQHVLQQLVQRATGSGGLGDVVQCARRSAVARFVDPDQDARRNEGQKQADRHLRH